MKAGKVTNKADLAKERLILWSETLNMLSLEEAPSKLITILEANDRKGLEALLEQTKLFQMGVCIDIINTIIHVINFGHGHYEERCNVVFRPVFEPLSETDGKIYQLPNGSFVFISERIWFDYYTRAQQDPVWRAQNKTFLKAIGVLTCSFVWVSDSELISETRTKTICFQTVITP